MSSRTWLHRPDQWPTSAVDLARTRSHSRGAVMTSPVSTGHRAWSRSRGHEPLATRSTRRSTCTTSARRSASRTHRSEVSSRSSSYSTSRIPRPSSPEIRRCLRPGGHLLITAPARDSTSLTSQNLYWRLRAACYQHVPGVVRFYDTSPSLPRLVEDQGLTVVKLLVGSALQSRVEAQNGARADPATARPNRQGRTKYLSAQSPGDAVLVPDSADDQDCHAYGFAAPHNHPRGQRTTFM